MATARMRVSVLMPDGCIKSGLVDPWTLTRQLAGRLVLARDMCLKFRGEAMDGDTALSHYGVENGSQLSVVPRERVPQPVATTPQQGNEVSPSSAAGDEIAASTSYSSIAASNEMLRASITSDPSPAPPPAAQDVEKEVHEDDSREVCSLTPQGETRGDAFFWVGAGGKLACGVVQLLSKRCVSGILEAIELARDALARALSAQRTAQAWTHSVQLAHLQLQQQLQIALGMVEALSTSLAPESSVLSSEDLAASPTASIADEVSHGTDEHF